MTAQVIDLFCGIGGLSRGLIDAGLDVIAGYDNDATCQYTYEKNNNAKYICQDIREVSGSDIQKLYEKGTKKILVGCAPCQPFSRMRVKWGNANEQDEKYNLLKEFQRLILEVNPDIIAMENVPHLKNTEIYRAFAKKLKEEGYHIDERIVFCPDYGVPQTRKRFIMLGSKLGEIQIIGPTHESKDIHLEDFIKNLPQIKAGEVSKKDLLHRSARLTEKNLKRIKASVPGGTWKDWPEELKCECHKKESGKTYGSVYGRLTWDQIGPTITTQFYNYGTGRFGHPEQNRALSLREGAILQTFPQNYDFINPNYPIRFSDIARHIGNAVPVKLGEAIGRSIKEHLNSKG